VFIQETDKSTADNPKNGGAEGFQRASGKPFGRLRSGEIPATQQINQLKNKENCLKHSFYQSASA
jgi:hypothetical protein